MFAPPGNEYASASEYPYAMIWNGAAPVIRCTPAASGQRRASYALEPSVPAEYAVQLVVGAPSSWTSTPTSAPITTQFSFHSAGDRNTYSVRACSIGGKIVND